MGRAPPLKLRPSEEEGLVKSSRYHRGTTLIHLMTARKLVTSFVRVKPKLLRPLVPWTVVKLGNAKK